MIYPNTEPVQDTKSSILSCESLILDPKNGVEKNLEALATFLPVHCFPDNLLSSDEIKESKDLTQETLEA